MCPHTTIYVSSYYSTCVLILLYICPHTAIYVSSYYSVCVLILLYVSAYYYVCVLIPQYVSASYFICVLVLPYTCPHTTPATGGDDENSAIEAGAASRDAGGSLRY
jgi:hypothetical protein